MLNTTVFPVDTQYNNAMMQAVVRAMYCITSPCLARDCSNSITFSAWKQSNPREARSRKLISDEQANTQSYPAPISIVYTVARCTGSGFIREDEGLLQPAVEAVSDLITDAQSLLLASR